MAEACYSEYTRNQNLTVKLGLHPESLVSLCDVCGRRTNADGETALTQSGRFMVHDACYQDYAYLESLRRPALDYGQVRHADSEAWTNSPRSLIARMRKRLDAERAHAFATLKLFWRPS